MTFDLENRKSMLISVTVADRQPDDIYGEISVSDRKWSVGDSKWYMC